ncbi:MAG: hypothetical protein ACQEUZ_02530 [Pseudomonadota bacterium]
MRQLLRAVIGSLGLSVLGFAAFVQVWAYLRHGALIQVDAVALHGMIWLQDCGPRWADLARVAECRGLSAGVMGLAGPAALGLTERAAAWLADLWLGGYAAAAMLVLLPQDDRPRRRPLSPTNLPPARRARQAALRRGA